MKKDTLDITNPELAKQWHPTKNGNLKPSNVTKGSGKKVWWMCGLGHEWHAVIASRANGRGCPVCSNQVIKEGFNDLKTTNPELAKEWHPTKNGDLKPSDVMAGSGNKVWWLCELGHEWEATINSRNRGNRCPICSNKVIKEGFNDLKTTNPELAKEWHPTKNGDLKPSDVMAGSGNKVWWLCELGHEWEATIVKRNLGSGCPVCSNQVVQEGFNDLKTTNPELAKEWHPTKNGGLKPSDVIAGSNKKVWWVCELGHEWKASVNSRNRGSRCPICSNQVVQEGFNDLKTTNPELAKEWHPTKNGDLKSSDVIPGSHKKVWWVCELGHEWEATVAKRNKGNRCPICSNKVIKEGFNDLKTTNPELAKEWHPTKNGDLKSSDVTKGSNRKVWWLCSKDKNHEWEAVINSRKANIGCPYCSSRTATKGVNDLKTTNPELAKEWHPTKNGDLKPSDVTKGSGKKVWWICESGHEWETAIYNRGLNGNGCPKCNMYGTSKIEQAVFYYLLKVFKDAKNRYSIDVCGNKMEVDIYIPSIGLSIEYDGEYWHKNRYEKDTEKSSKLKSKTKLLRIREYGLDSIEHCDNILINKIFRYTYEMSDFVVKEILCYIKEEVEIDMKTMELIDNIYINSKKHKSYILKSYNKHLKRNSIVVTHPELAKEWHPTKNGDLKPEIFSSGSTENVWWVCSKNKEHEWEANIYNRTKGTGCPICCNKKVIEGYNDLKTTYPELAKEWHPTKNGDLTPTNITPGSGKNVWWMCELGHEWKIAVRRRTNGSSCPHCKKNKK